MAEKLITVASYSEPTAAHIAHKLAVHFVSENPPEDLVNAITKTYRDTGGDLMAVYKTLLEHPASAAPMGAKVKWPTEFVISTIRALDLAEEFAELRPREVRNALQSPMQAMGMNIFRPSGPDGWSEAAADWITPPSLAAHSEASSGSGAFAPFRVPLPRSPPSRN